MHEMGITRGILDAAIGAAEEAGATRITEIHITVGELTEVVDFALQFAFEALTPGTMAEGATLVVDFLPATSRCLECEKLFEHGRFDMVCPSCGSFSLELQSGRELRVDSIEADEGEPGAAEAAAEEPLAAGE